MMRRRWSGCQAVGVVVAAAIPAFVVVGTTRLAARTGVASKFEPAFPRPGAKVVKDGRLVAIWDVTRQKGQSTGMRELALDQIAVTLTEGAVRVTRPDGSSFVQQEPFGSVRFESKGTIENEEGVSETPSRVIVFQLKPAEAVHLPPTEGIPGQFPRVGAHELFETDKVRVWDQTWRAGERITRHLHYGQTATVFLVGGKLRTIDEGQSPNPAFGRVPGEVLYSDTLRPLQAPHEEEQVEGVPRAIWLEFK
jgi:hypothetical protein